MQGIWFTLPNLRRLKPEQRLAGLNPEQLEVLESYLKQRHKQKGQP
jgi:hypothetical protein